ncbi:MAG: ABC transporter permease [Bacteroidetes bacterium]|nr:ABC transporter permease [Bacteroidota bacterium]MDA0943540.1 ABC transporter permease [Bacteroidota bacterium]MDA1112594.1 ABC transporter permease [Bacteroidota bacterium]
MHKIGIIFRREYLSRIRNKSFIVMTLIGPFLLALFYGGMIWVGTEAVNSTEDGGPKKVTITGQYPGLTSVGPSESFAFQNTSNDLESTKALLNEGSIDVILDIRDLGQGSLDSVTAYSTQSLSLRQERELRSHLELQLHRDQLQSMGLDPLALDSLRQGVELHCQTLSDTGDAQNSATTLKSGVGFVMAFLIYLFIFLYGSMVMRGALEEKTNRIVEVIISSVRPFELMMGKILGVAAVGLTQFLVWIAMGAGLITGLSRFFGPQIQQGLENTQSMQGAGSQALQTSISLWDQFHSLPFGKIIFVFVLFFLGGYLLYSSLFAAIGAAASQDTDVQSFMLPVSLPLVFGLLIAQASVIQAPHGSLATWFSYIPLTSPIVMVVRSPFDVSWLEIAGSAILLYSTFIAMVYLAAKIYRIGLLKYGKKPTWKDLYLWIRQSN